jgi:hypothetical protein
MILLNVSQWTGTKYPSHINTANQWHAKDRRWIAFAFCCGFAVVAWLLFVTSIAVAQNEDSVLSVFSKSEIPPVGEFDFTSTTAVDLSGSNWGFGVSEEDVYHAALKHLQNDGPANRNWEIRIGLGGQIYSIRSDVGEIVPPQSFSRPYNDEVFQAISVDTSTRETGGQAIFYHQSGYYVDNRAVTQPTFAPLLASGSIDVNAWSTMSLAVQADAQSIPKRPSELLNYQRTLDLGGGVIEITHVIYNFGVARVNFHNLPWGGVRKTVFDSMLVSDPNGGFTQRQIDDFDLTANQVVTADRTGGWAAFTEGIARNDRGLAYVFGDRDPHLSQSWQRSKSSWRWGDGGGDFLGLPIRNFHVGTFRREIDIDSGDLFESRYFLVLGDVAHIESTIVDRELVKQAVYNKRTITLEDSSLLGWQISGEGQNFSVVDGDASGPSDFRTYALPVRGSRPLFLLVDSAGDTFVSVDPYALSDNPYDGQTDYRRILGFVLPPEMANDLSQHVDLQTVFAGSDRYLKSDLGTAFFALAGLSVPAAATLLGDVNQDGSVDFSDIPPFIALLSSGGYLVEADSNRDGVVDFADIAPFIEILSGD